VATTYEIGHPASDEKTILGSIDKVRKHTDSEGHVVDQTNRDIDVGISQ
jgi:hypothetical protein